MTITIQQLERMQFTNSKDLPRKIKFLEDGEIVYKEWVGIGWINIDPNNEAVEVTGME